MSLRNDGNLRDRWAAYVLFAMILALAVYSCQPAPAAEAQGPPPASEQAADLPPLLLRIAQCPTGNEAVVGSNNSNIMVATLMLMDGRIDRDQYIALVQSEKPDKVDAARHFVIACFGAPT